MDAGDYISAASAVVAAAAAAVGWWQSHSARRAATAAEEQVNVMRGQLELEHSRRDDGLRPRFEVTQTTTMLLPGGEGRLAIEIAQTTGVPLDDVKAELYVGRTQIVPDEADTCLFSAPGSKITVRAHLDAGIAQASAIRIELSGTEARGTRQWVERLIAHPAVTDGRLLSDWRRSLNDEGWQRAELHRSPRAGGATSSGLPRRVPRANLVPGNNASPPQGGPQVSRAPDDVRGRLINLRRGIQQGRKTGIEKKDQGSGPDRTHNQER